MAWNLSPDEQETVALIARLARERFARAPRGTMWKIAFPTKTTQTSASTGSWA